MRLCETVCVNFDVETSKSETIVKGSNPEINWKKHIETRNVNLRFAWIVTSEYLPFEVIALILLESKTQKP